MIALLQVQRLETPQLSECAVSTGCFSIASQVNCRPPTCQTGVQALQVPKLGASMHKALLSQAIPMYGSKTKSSFLIWLPLPLLTPMGFEEKLFQSRRCSLQALPPWPYMSRS